jgi:hypothetical protein
MHCEVLMHNEVLMHIGGRTELLEYHPWPCKFTIPAKFVPTLDISPPSTTMCLVEQWWTPSTEDSHEAVVADVRPILILCEWGFQGLHASCRHPPILSNFLERIKLSTKQRS